MTRKQKWQRIIYMAIVLLVIGLIASRGNGSTTQEGTTSASESVQESETPADASGSSAPADLSDDNDSAYVTYTFRDAEALQEHYQKHGVEMGFASALEYEQAASDVINNPKALHKTEAEDGDDVYYLEETNDFVIVATYGSIRTYFRPDAGIDYYNRQ
ncbi:MAG: hypothetical protein K6G23_10635 [Lachnospiraceae bacterium]|nr:hypothetical protein [Lachnospiraceae bacterium]